MIWQFTALLAGHWFADFVFQSHWMASNKSKRNDALAIHVASYSCTMLVVAMLAFAWSWQSFGLVFVLIGVNAFLHFCTDYVTSRWSSRLWAEQRWHDFFVVIGLDQLIHQVTLAVLVAWLFGGSAA